MNPGRHQHLSVGIGKGDCLPKRLRRNNQRSKRRTGREFGQRINEKRVSKMEPSGTVVKFAYSVLWPAVCMFGSIHVNSDVRHTPGDPISSFLLSEGAPVLTTELSGGSSTRAVDPPNLGLQGRQEPRAEVKQGPTGSQAPPPHTSLRQQQTISLS